MPRVLMNFQHRNQWSVHYVEADCRTPIQAGRYYHYSTLDQLRQILASANASPETVQDFEMCIRQWNKGSVWLDLSDEQYAKLKG